MLESQGADVGVGAGTVVVDEPVEDLVAIHHSVTLIHDRQARSHGIAPGGKLKSPVSRE